MTNLVQLSKGYSPVTSVKPTLTHRRKMEPNAQSVLTRGVRNARASNREGLNRNPTRKCWRVCGFAWPRYKHRTADSFNKRTGIQTNPGRRNPITYLEPPTASFVILIFISFFAFNTENVTTSNDDIERGVPNRSVFTTWNSSRRIGICLA